MSSPVESGGLRVHRSNRVEVHATLLASFLQHRSGPTDPIRPDTVVVGNRGTERWLGHRLAHSLGVCANVRFPFPAGVIHTLIAWALRGSPRPTSWSHDALHWAVVDTLRTLDTTDPTWRPLTAWMLAESPLIPGVVDRRTLGLSRQLADVLDRLMTYRPEWVTAWDTAVPTTLPDGVAPWLPALWRSVVHQLGPGHHAERIVEAVAALRTSTPGRAPYSHLHIFGLGSLPPAWLELLGAAALHLPTDLYLLTPSNQYWSDVRRGSAALPSPLLMARDRLASRLEAVLPPDDPVLPGRTRPNPTLATFGRIARDFQAVLERLPEGYRDAPHAEAEVFVDPIVDSDASEGPPGTALQWLQSDILHMRHPADHKARLDDFERRRLDPTDTSIELHACYGLTRQLEALRDALLHRFAADPHLQPRDVVVLCPDIQKVAPLVSAVFDSGRSPGAPPPIPARVTDRTVREVNPVAEVVLRLLTMGPDRLDAPGVLDLLALEPVGARFGIPPEDLPEVVQLVRASGARWARDADHRAHFGQPADPLCTWRFGLERLALGVVMADDPTLPPPFGLLPEDRAGGVPFELVGRLLEFMAALSHILDQLSEPRSPADWVHTLDDVLDRFVAPTTPAGFRIRQVREAVQKLDNLPAPLPLAPRLRLDAPAVAAWLERPLGADTGPLGQQTGAVTFCSMLPERGVPAKVVCLLGMDDGDFPRTTSSLGFDPTATHPRVGDRDPRDEDRYLLLEALLAAREAVVVFWTGRDVRSNEVIAPAVPVGELIDILEASFLPPPGWSSVQEHLIIHHPLQPFSPRALTPGGLAPKPQKPGAAPHRLASVRWTYDRRLEASARQPRDRRPSARLFWPPELLLPASVGAPDLPFDELLGFWRQPVAWLVERELGLWLRDTAEQLPGREPLELDGLERYGLMSDLVAGVLDEARSVREQVLTRHAARGLLPPGMLGTMAVDDAWASVRRASTLLEPHRTPTKPARIEVDLGGAGRLTGSLPDVGDGVLTAMVVGQNEGRKVLHTWLSAVALTASGIPTRAIVAWTGSNTKKPDIIAYVPFDGDRHDARDYLHQLAAWRAEGRQHPLPFGPRSSWAFMAKKVGKSRVGDLGSVSELTPKARVKGSKAALDHWWGSERLRGDLHHPALERVFGRSCPIVDEHNLVTDSFATLAFGLWGPLLAGEASP